MEGTLPNKRVPNAVSDVVVGAMERFSFTQPLSQNHRYACSGALHKMAACACALQGTMEKIEIFREFEIKMS